MLAGAGHDGQGLFQIFRRCGLAGHQFLDAVAGALVLGPAGLRFRGHQFRYSELQPLKGQIDCAYRVVRRRDGQVVSEGYAVKNTLASYVHAHWASNPTIAERLVDACVRQTQNTNEMRE